MKKLLVLGCVVLAGVAAFGEDITANFSDLEAQFQALQDEEKALYDAKKQEAMDAQEKLKQQKVMYAEITAKEKSLANSKKSKVMGDQYADLANRFKEIKKQLEVEMKANEKIVADFNKMGK